MIQRGLGESPHDLGLAASHYSTERNFMFARREPGQDRCPQPSLGHSSYTEEKKGEE